MGKGKGKADLDDLNFHGFVSLGTNEAGADGSDNLVNEEFLLCRRDILAVSPVPIKAFRAVNVEGRFLGPSLHQITPTQESKGDQFLCLREGMEGRVRRGVPARAKTSLGENGGEPVDSLGRG